MFIFCFNFGVLMKLETKSGVNFKSFFLKFKIPFFEKSFNAKFLFYNTPKTWVLGYSSRTDQGKYVLFHDFDSLNWTDIIQELKFLQKTFNLSDYFVFELDRENSFHAVCLDTFTLIEAYEIQKTTSCDLAFVHSIKNLKTKEWVLRISEKGKRAGPNWITTLKSKGNRVKSSAHASFLRKIGITVPKKGRWDNCKKLGLVKYNTSNRV